MSLRDYGAIMAQVSPLKEREATLRQVVDALWNGLYDLGVSWVGVYRKDPDADQLLLGPRRDKPACSPIGMHGACGRAFLSRENLLVHDVAALGQGYVACDPRDRSEVIIPLFDEDDSCWGVLDVDSFDLGAFDHSDVTGLCAVLNAAGLPTHQRVTEV